MSLAVKDLHLLRGEWGGCGESNEQVSSANIQEIRAMEGNAMGEWEGQSWGWESLRKHLQEGKEHSVSP